MYFRLENEYISDRELIGVFDMDGTTISSRTRDFLKRAQDGGEVVYTSYELPKAFVVTAEKDRRAPKRRKVYITQYLPQTVLRHIGQKLRTE